MKTVKHSSPKNGYWSNKMHPAQKKRNILERQTYNLLLAASRVADVQAEVDLEKSLTDCLLEAR